MKPPAAAAGAVILLGAAVLCAALSGGVTRYLAICTALTTAAAALLWSSRERAAGEPPALRIPSLPVLLAVYLLAAVPLAWWSRGVTGSADESAYAFQARALASGSLTAAAPTAQTVDNTHKNGFFFVHHVIRDGRWFGKYPPGWPALLAAGQLARIDWLLNPLLGLVLLYLAYRIGALCFSEDVARIAVAILVLSPMFVLNCIGYYSHGLSGVLLAAAAYAALLAIRQRHPAAVFAMAAASGAAFLVRPFSAVCFFLVFLGALWWSAHREPSQAFRFLALSAGGAGIGLAVFLSYNYAISGRFFVTGYALYRDGLHELAGGGGQLVANLTSLTARAFVKTAVSVAAFPCLLWFAAAAWVRKPETFLLAALSAVLVAGYSAQNEMSDTLVGERYYFESLFPLAVLAAAGLAKAPAGFRFPAHAVRYSAALFLVLQLIHYTHFGRTVQERLQPFRSVRAAIAASPLSGAVMFLTSSERFRPEDFNLNEADWRNADLFFLPDPGPAQRDSYACAAGRPRWVLCSYSESGARIGQPQPVSCRPGN